MNYRKSWHSVCACVCLWCACAELAVCVDGNTYLHHSVDACVVKFECYQCDHVGSIPVCMHHHMCVCYQLSCGER